MMLKNITLMTFSSHINTRLWELVLVSVNSLPGEGPVN